MGSRVRFFAALRMTAQRQSATAFEAGPSLRFGMTPFVFACERGRKAVQAAANTKATGPAKAGRYRRKDLERGFAGCVGIVGEILRCAQNDGTEATATQRKATATATATATAFEADPSLRFGMTPFYGMRLSIIRVRVARLMRVATVVTGARVRVARVLRLAWVVWLARLVGHSLAYRGEGRRLG